MAIVQSKTPQILVGNTHVVTFDNEFTPGNAIVIVLTHFNHIMATPSTLSQITTNKGHTFTKRVGQRRAPSEGTITDMWSEVHDCLNAADASPSTKISFSFVPVTANGNNNLVVSIFELSDISSFGLVGAQSGGNPNQTSVSAATAVPTALPQIAFNAMGTFHTNVVPPTGWNTTILNSSGSGPRGGIAWKDVTTATAITSVWQYSTAIYGSATALASYVVTPPVTLRIKFELDPATFTSDDTAVEGYLWTEGFPDTHLAKFYSGLAGHATAGKLYITSGLPAGLVANQQVKGIFHNGTYTTGLITGIVEAV